MYEAMCNFSHLIIPYSPEDREIGRKRAIETKKREKMFICLYELRIFCIPQTILTESTKQTHSEIRHLIDSSVNIFGVFAVNRIISKTIIFLSLLGFSLSLLVHSNFRFHALCVCVIKNSLCDVA